MELYIECKGDVYELYNSLIKYFEVEVFEGNNTMGLGDLKVIFEPIAKSIEVLGNIIISFINKDRCSITVKNKEREISFDGNPGALDNREVIELLEKILEE